MKISAHENLGTKCNVKLARIQLRYNPKVMNNISAHENLGAKLIEQVALCRHALLRHAVMRLPRRSGTRGIGIIRSVNAQVRHRGFVHIPAKKK